MSLQRCFCADMTSKRCTMSNQRWNNFVYVKVEIYNVEQRRINVFHFNIGFNNVRQRRNNVVIFKEDFHNVGQHWNNVVNMTAGLKIFFSLFSILWGICKRRFAGRKVLKTWNILNYKNYIWTISLCKMLTSF